MFERELDTPLAEIGDDAASIRARVAKASWDLLSVLPQLALADQPLQSSAPGKRLSG